MATNTLRRAGTVAVLMTAFGMVPPAQAADPREQVLAAWKARQAQFKTVRYTVTGKYGSRPSNATVDAPPSRAVVLFDIPNHRYRFEQETPRLSSRRDGTWAMQTKVTTYNNTDLREFFPRDRNDRAAGDADMHISTGDLSHAQMELLLSPLFEAHGIVPTVGNPIYSHRLPLDHDPEDFEVMGTGLIGPRRCLTLKTEPSGSLRDELWVDLERQAAVARRLYFGRGPAPFIRLEIEHQAIARTWLPKKWTYTTPGDMAPETDRREVINIELDPAVTDADFTVPVGPGMLVEEHKYAPKASGLNTVLPATKTSRVREDGGRQTISETGFRTRDGVELPP